MDPTTEQRLFSLECRVSYLERISSCAESRCTLCGEHTVTPLEKRICNECEEHMPCENNECCIGRKAYGSTICKTPNCNTRTHDACAIKCIECSWLFCIKCTTEMPNGQHRCDRCEWCMTKGQML